MLQGIINCFEKGIVNYFEKIKDISRKNNSQNTNEEQESFDKILKKYLGAKYNQLEEKGIGSLEKLEILINDGKNQISHGKSELNKRRRIIKTLEGELEIIKDDYKTLRDATVPRKILEMTLREIPKGIITVDANLLITSYNPEAEKYSQFKLIENSSCENILYHAEIFRDYRKNIINLKEGEQEKIFINPGKNIKKFYMTFEPIYSEKRLDGYKILIEPGSIFQKIKNKMSSIDKSLMIGQETKALPDTN